MTHEPKFSPYTYPAGGWGSIQLLDHSLSRILARQNDRYGFARVSCSKPAKLDLFAFCEDGVKGGEITTRRCAPALFAKRSVGSLALWTDHGLEKQGRLTHPLPCDAATGKMRARRLDRGNRGHWSRAEGGRTQSVVCYCSGPSSPETYMIAGEDSSEVCPHPERIGGDTSWRPT